MNVTAKRLGIFALAIMMIIEPSVTFTGKGVRFSGGYTLKSLYTHKS